MKNIHENYKNREENLNIEIVSNKNDINNLNNVDNLNNLNNVDHVDNLNNLNNVDHVDHVDHEIEKIDISKSQITPQWTKFYELILIDWCDKAMCYRYLHGNCNRYYSFMNIMFTIPVIFISTLTGVANFAQERIPEEYVFYYTIGVGSLNILAGFITTVSQFLKIAELNESHKVSAVSWGKLHRNIKLELAKKPAERDNVKTFIKNSKEYYELLIETSPSIKHSEILHFNKKFKKGEFWKPEICDSLTSVKYTMYEDEPEKIDIGTTTQTPSSNPSPRKNINIDTMLSIKRRRDTIINSIELDEFVKSYMKENGRSPSVEEIYDNMEDKINKKYIDQFVQRLHKQK